MGELPEYNLPNLSGTYANQLGQYDEILTAANAKGLINHTPTDDKETYDFKKQRIRLQTISSRLYLLGYLRNKISSRRIEKNKELIKQAVFNFQNDANLKTDYWVGDKTWYALDELVSFDSHFTYDKWFVDDKIKPEVLPAMHRAIQLRMSCLGLYGQKPNSTSKLLSKVSLFKLGKILKIFKLKDKDFIADFDYSTINALFNHDSLINAIANFSVRNRNLVSFNFESCDSEKEQILAKKFISNCAKIELWLLGYEINIDGKDDFEYRRSSDLRKKIFRYYLDYEKKKRSTARRLAKKFSPKLFMGFDLTTEKADKFKEDNASEEVYKIMMPEEKAKRNGILVEAWSYIKERGMRLWDGLKRIWRWIKRKGKQAFTFLKENIFKAFYRFVSKAYKIITKGISAVVKSFGVYIKGALASNQVLLSFSKDMDTETYIDNRLTVENGEMAVQKIQKQSKAFNLGCRILGFVFNIFKNAMTGIFGWAKLLFSLLKSYKDIKLIYRDFKEVAGFA